MPAPGISPIRLITFGLVACALALAVSARPQAQASDRLEVQSVAIVGSTLTIKGVNFGANPAVKVGAEAATIDRSSDTEIVATTGALEAGIYPLTVSRDATEGGTVQTSLLVP